jgi:glycosyltransferase involved in cell wall biosynthesis
MQPLVTVIIPTYKREEKLERALDSILGQTYKNLEILVIDDNGKGSDNQQKVELLLARYLKAENPFFYVVNDVNMGAALTRNKGIRLAKGEYIAFIDDDDEYYPEKIEKQIELFLKKNNDNLAMVYCYCENYDERNNKVHEIRLNDTGNCVFEAMVRCIATTSQWLCKTESLREVGGFDNVPSLQDSNLILKLLVKGYEIDRVEQVLSRYNMHSDLKISNLKQDKVDGMVDFKWLCRDYYYLLQEDQIPEVEKALALRASKTLIRTGLTEDLPRELKILWRLNKTEYWKVIVYSKLFPLLKDRVRINAFR